MQATASGRNSSKSFFKHDEDSKKTSPCYSDLYSLGLVDYVGLSQKSERFVCASRFGPELDNYDECLLGAISRQSHGIGRLFNGEFDDHRFICFGRYVVEEGDEGDASMNTPQPESITSATVWQRLLEAKLVEGEMPVIDQTQSLTQPWYIRVMLGFSGWLGALFLMGFVGIFMGLAGDHGIVTVCIVTGKQIGRAHV